MDLLSALSVFTTYPILVGIPSIVICLLFFIAKHRVVLLIGLFLMGFLPIVFTTKLEHICEGECAIPVDLLLISLQILIAVFMGIAFYLLSVYGEWRR